MTLHDDRNDSQGGAADGGTDSFWDKPARRRDDTPTIQLQRVRKRSGERTRTHHVVTRDTPRTGGDATPARGGRRNAPAPFDVDFDDAVYDDGAYRNSRYIADEFDERGFGDGADDHRSAEEIWLEPANRRPVSAGSGPLSGLLGNLDPRLLSVGAIALASVLAVPLFGALGDDSANGMRSVTASEVTTTLAPTTTTIAPSTTAAVDASSADGQPAEEKTTATDEALAAAGGSTSSGEEAGATSATTAPAASTESAATESAAAATGDGATEVAGASDTADGSGGLPAPAQRVAAHCGNPYEVQAGDFWARIAEATGTGLDEFVAYNNATTDTALFPGDIVCLPLGTSVTTTTAVPETTVAPDTTAPAPSTTAAPAPAPEEPENPPAPEQPAPEPTPTTTQAPSTDPPPAEPAEGVWDRLAQCEAGGNWSINTGNGYYGGLQFALSSWRAVGGTGYPHEHSRAEQIKRGEMLLEIQGWGAWPTCSSRLGLR